MTSDTKDNEKQQQTRRGFLRALGLGAGAAAGAGALGVANAQSVGLGSSDGATALGSSESGVVRGALGRNSRARFLAGDLQVLTVTENSVTVSWSTWNANVSVVRRPQGLPTQGTFSVWPAGQPQAVKTVESTVDTFFHLLTIDGLEPDTDYEFSATSHGIQPTFLSTITESGGLTFTTLPAPTGQQLGSIVVTNDTHIGEQLDGLLFANFPPPAMAAPGQPPYAEVCLNAGLSTAQTYGASHFFINGDVTSEARPAEVRRAQEILSTFKGVTRTTRGNHDRPHRRDDSSGYETCPVYDETHFDCYGQVFNPRQQAWEMDIPGADMRVIGIDSTALDIAGGQIDPQQFLEIERMLLAQPRKNTIVMLHHPTTRDAAFTNIGGPAFVLRDSDLMRLQQLIARAPGVRLVLTGHTHRARKNKPDVNTQAVFLECPSCKNWPTGVMHIRIYENGLMVNFRHHRSPEALIWAGRTRWTAFGLASQYQLGPVEARNLSVSY